jgi:hypothetical protein
MIETEPIFRTQPPDFGTNFAPPVQAHLGSLGDLLGEMSVNDSLGQALDHFVNGHDVGYSVNPANWQSQEELTVMAEVLEGVGTAARVDDVMDYFRVNAGNVLATKVVGHAFAGVLKQFGAYKDQGYSHDEALGIAMLFAAHHPGFPISMVAGFLPKGTLPIELRSALFVDRDGTDPEGLRRTLMAFGTEKLGIDPDTADKFALLGYALDRISPARQPHTIELVGDRANVSGGEVVDKKYPLVTGDLLRQDPEGSPDVARLYAQVEAVITEETQAAVHAAEFAGQLEVASLVSAKANEVVGATKDTQTRALAALSHLGLSGTFAAMHDETRRLLEHLGGQSTPDPDALYALATYQQVAATISRH